MEIIKRTDQVVKILRNCAKAKARNAEIRGRLLGRKSDDDDGGESKNDVAWALLNDAASPTVITSSIISIFFFKFLFFFTKIMGWVDPQQFAIYSSHNHNHNHNPLPLFLLSPTRSEWCNEFPIAKAFERELRSCQVGAKWALLGQ